MMRTSPQPGPTENPFALGNIRRFIAFRLLFNARFYYPVFTVLFLDYGLTLEQFALLNTVWALTIVLAEVPSGALADIIGRKKLVLAASTLMVCEMLCIVCSPSSGAAVFWIFLINRVFSGLAEAMASGSDEALAYDTLVAHNLAEQWPHVLDRQMRLQGMGFIFAMTLGAAVYDHDLLNRALGWLGLPGGIGHNLSMRLPVLLTLGFALLAVVVTWGMEEPERRGPAAPQTGLRGILAAGGHTLRAGLWILGHPQALAVILFAMTLDHTLRMLATLTSPYYRLIGLPDASFGLIGSAVAVVGLAVPPLARRMAERLAPGLNLALLSLAMIAALAWIARFTPFWGLLPMAALFLGMTMTSFFASHYLNARTDSAHRATVLSFKSMACNVAYGGIGLAFAALIRHERLVLAGRLPGVDAAALDNAAFQAAVAWSPWYLVFALAAMLAVTLIAQRCFGPASRTPGA